MNTRKIKRTAAVFLLTLIVTMLILIATINTEDSTFVNSDDGTVNGIHTIIPEDDDSNSENHDDKESTQNINSDKSQKIEKISVSEELLPSNLRVIAEKHNVIGMAIIIMENGQISHAYSYGIRNTDTGEAFNTDSVLRVASVSGLVSTIGIMQLVDKNLLDLDEPIGNYLGYTVKNIYNGSNITLRQILTHTASISDYGAYDKITSNELEYKSLKEMLNGNYAKSNFYDIMPGYKYAYSNFGGALIAAIVSAVTQESFNDYMTESLFQPLNIDAAYLSTEIANRENISNIYRQNKVSYSLENMDNFSEKLSTISPENNYRCSHANLFINAKDLSRIAQLLINDGEIDGIQILSREAVKEILSTEAKGSLYRDVGYGFYVSKRNDIIANRTLYGLQGGAYGATAEFFFDPSDKSGIVLLVNGSNNAVLENGISEMGYDFINEIYSSIIGD